MCRLFFSLRLNIDRYYSFCRYFEETCGRLLYNVCESVNGDSIPLQAAYTLACFKYAQIDGHFNPTEPAKSMSIFAKLLHAYGSTSYLVIDNSLFSPSMWLG
jgi:hypothetical protein